MASSISASSISGIPEVSRSPHQPRSNFKFSKRSYRLNNAVQRSFRHSSASSISEIPEVSRSPHQPRSNFKFPKRSYGPKNAVQRSFQHSWFKQCPFFHYDEANDVAYTATYALWDSSRMRNSKATNLMTLHVHKAATDMLKSSDIANDFVGDSDHRLKNCGTS